MSFEKLLGNQSVIISLNIDKLLMNRLKQISEAGFNVVEINSTDTQILSQIITDHPHLKIGAGGITDTQQLESCFNAGVHFATSPGFLPSLAQTSTVYSINYLPGVATISEAMEAMSFGFTYLRPFPASLSFCALLNKCLPHLKLFPGDIEGEEAEHFLSLPSVSAVGIHEPDKKQLNVLSSGVLA